jgi:hypothetical protein
MRRISIERKKMGRSQRILNPENSLVNNAEVKSMENNDLADIFLPLKNSLDRKEINKWEKITGKDTVFVSFISNPPGSDFYSEKAKHLVFSLDSLGYDYCVVHFENDRNYYQNCCFKPSYIKSKINEYNKNIVWIDGDTFLKRDVKDFIDSSRDFDIGLVSYNNDMSGFVASPIFFKNTPISIDLIEKWSEHCKSKVENGECELDHDALKHEILPEFRNSIRIRLNWDDTNSLHNGSILNNVNSEVPHKREILDRMSIINRSRPFNYLRKDFIII